ERNASLRIVTWLKGYIGMKNRPSAPMPRHADPGSKIWLVNSSVPFMFRACMSKSFFLLRGAVAALVAAFLLTPAIAPAQVPGAGGSMMNSALLKLFGDHTAFSCKAEIHVLDAIQKETDVVPFAFAVADGKMRLDIDFAQIKNPDIPPAMIPTLKQI